MSFNMLCLAQTNEANQRIAGRYISKILRKKSPRTATKTKMKICNSKKEEFKEQVTAEGEEMNVKVVPMDVNKLEYLPDDLTKTGQTNNQLKKDIHFFKILFTENMVKKI